MLNDLTSTAVLPLIGAAVLSLGVQRLYAHEEAAPMVRSEMLVSTSWLEQHLNDRGLVVLFIGQGRTNFDSGHIPGSRFVRLDELVEQNKDSLNELPAVADLTATFEALGVGAGSRVVLTDDVGGVLAARVYFTLDYLGHGDDTALLDGGMKAWIAESRKMSREEPPVAHAEFIPHMNPGVLVSTAQMRQLSLDATRGVADSVLLDARPLAEHTGVVKSESIPQAGHIPGSQSLYWKKLIRSDANPQLLPAEELRERFAQAGATDSRPVVTYCRTGMQSSFTYFVAKYLGFRAAMYDGSVYEWVRAAGYSLVNADEPEQAAKAHP